MCVRQADRTAKTGNSTRADYRPVLSYILNDYMFRCPTWRAAHLLQEKSQPGVDVYVFQFSHPTRVSPPSAIFRAQCPDAADERRISRTLVVFLPSYSRTTSLPRLTPPSCVCVVDAGAAVPRMPRAVMPHLGAALRLQQPRRDPRGLRHGLRGAQQLHRLRSAPRPHYPTPSPRTHHALPSWDHPVITHPAAPSLPRNILPFSSFCPCGVADFLTDLVWGVFLKVDEDEKLASLMSDYWTTFAKTSTPNFNGAPLDWKLWKGKRRCVCVFTCVWTGE